MILTFNRLCCVDFVFLTLNCVVFLTLGCFCVSHLVLILCFLPCVVLCWFCVSHLSKAPSHPGSRHGVQALPETVGNLKTLCLYDDHQIAYDDLFIVQCWFIIRSNVLLAIVPFGNIFKCRNSSHGWGITDKWQCFMMMIMIIKMKMINIIIMTMAIIAMVEWLPTDRATFIRLAKVGAWKF